MLKNSKMKMNKLKKKIESKNAVENYTYSIRNTLKDEKVKDKISAEDREKCEKTVEEAVKWLEANANAESE